MAVQQARKEAMKKGVVFGLVAAVATTAIGYFAGGAIEMGKGRQKSVGDAKSLAGDVATWPPGRCTMAPPRSITEHQPRHARRRRRAEQRPWRGRWLIRLLDPLEQRERMISRNPANLIRVLPAGSF